MADQDILEKPEKDFVALSNRIREDLTKDRLDKEDTRLKTREKQLMALELRKHGYTFRKIAEAIGCTTAYAEKIFKRALKEVTREKSEELLELEMQRLDELFIKPFANAILHGDDKDIKSCLNIMERRSRLLGMDGAIKFENISALDSPRAQLLGLLGITLVDDDAENTEETEIE